MRSIIMQCIPDLLLKHVEKTKTTDNIQISRCRLASRDVSANAIGPTPCSVGCHHLCPAVYKDMVKSCNGQSTSHRVHHKL